MSQFFIGAAGRKIKPDPLTEEEYVAYVQRVNCGTCWARPDTPCNRLNGNGAVIIPTQPILNGFHPSRETRAWAKLGVPPRVRQEA
jgi:hypothetical protein